MTLGITALPYLRVHIENKIWDLDVDSTGWSI